VGSTLTTDATKTAGKVLVHRTMSLDGFIAGTDDAMAWIFEYVASDEFPETIAATGAILAGRRTYEVGQRDTGKETGEAYGGAWTGPQFVLTHNPPQHAPDDVVFLAGDVQAAVDTALGAADGKNLEIFGGDLASQCLRLGLVDELLVHIVPVLLGDGTRLFSAAGGARIGLQVLSTTQSGSVTTIRYRVLNHNPSGRRPA
jgi:dihydrofolate reductase